MFKKLGSGRGVFDFVIEGEALIVNNLMDFNDNCDGKIIVVRHPSPDVYLLLKKAIGVVAESGGITSHLAISAIEMGRPAVVGVIDILSKVDNGMRLKVESIQGEGVVYAID